jgi:hypothetical protein
MSTESRRAAVKVWHEKRALSGDRKVTVWLSIAARAKLTELAKVSGSKDRAAERAIMEAGNPLYSIDDAGNISLVEGEK